MTRILLCAAALMPAMVAGCTERAAAAADAQKRPLHVVCYSGGVKILDDVSTDGVRDSYIGISYLSRTTGRHAQATGACTAFDDPVPAGWKPLIPGRNG